jgi:hypothetical protein
MKNFETWFQQEITPIVTKNQQLTKEAEERLMDWISQWGTRDCSCHISAPCGWCEDSDADPDNPNVLIEDESCWENVTHGEEIRMTRTELGREYP